MITGWLSDDDGPDCGGPLLDTSTSDQVLVLDSGSGYHATWQLTDDPDRPGEGRTYDPSPAPPGPSGCPCR